MKYVVHCPIKKADDVKAQFEEVKFFEPDDRVVYFESHEVSIVQVEFVAS